MPVSPLLSREIQNPTTTQNPHCYHPHPSPTISHLNFCSNFPTGLHLLNLPQPTFNCSFRGMFLKQNSDHSPSQFKTIWSLHFCGSKSQSYND